MRTRKEVVNANWDTIGEAVSIARKYDSSPSRTLILGNGDVQDIKDAEEKVKKYGVDGVMLGRAIFGNPWLFSRKYEGKEIPIKERLVVMVEHTKLFEKMYKGVKRFDVMKKHYKAYASEFDGAKELRVELMATKTTKDVEQIVKKFLKSQ